MSENTMPDAATTGETLQAAEAPARNDGAATSDPARQPSHIAYSVTGEGERRYWHRIGAAWPTKDDGLTLQLDAMPLDGRVALRSREALERMREDRQGTDGPQRAPEHGPKP